MNGSNYVVRLQATIDSKSLISKLQNEIKTIPLRLTIDTAHLRQQVESALQGITVGGRPSGGASGGAIATNVSGASGIRSANVSNIAKSTEEYGTLTKTVETATGAVTGYYKVQNDVAETINKVNENTGKLQQTTTNYEVVQKKTASGIKANQNAFDTLSKKISGMSKGLGVSKKQFNGLRATLDEVSKLMGDKTPEGIEKSSEAIRKLQNQVVEAEQQSKTSFQTMSSAVSKFTAWYLIAGVVTSIIGKIKEVISRTQELNKTFIDLQMVTQGTTSELADLRDEYISLAKSMGTTTDAVTEAATDFLRAGMSEVATNEAIKASLVLARAGAMDSAKATEVLISTMKAYNLEAKDLMSVVDKLSALDVEAATSSEDLGVALQKSANVAQLAGLSLDEYLGYLTVVSEVTQDSAESIGNSFKTILARLQQVKIGSTLDEEGEDISNFVSNVDRVLTQYGIDWMEVTNQLNDVGAGLDVLATKWDSLTTAEKSQIAQVIAGQRQYNRFLVLMENYSAAQEYAKISADSAGSAMQKYNTHLQSFEARMNVAKDVWDEVAATLVDSGIVDVLVDFVVEMSELLATTLRLSFAFLDFSGAMWGLNTAITTINIVLDLLNKALDIVATSLEKVNKKFKESKLGSWFANLYSDIKDWLKLDASDEIYKEADANDELAKSLKNVQVQAGEAKDSVADYLSYLITRLEDQKEVEDDIERAKQAQADIAEAELEVQDALLEVEKKRAELAEAREKKVRVFRTGKGFVYETDAEAVQSAQENLTSALKTYSDTIKTYQEKLSETMLTATEQAIEAVELLQEYYDQAKLEEYAKGSVKMQEYFANPQNFLAWAEMSYDEKKAFLKEYTATDYVASSEKTEEQIDEDAGKLLDEVLNGTTDPKVEPPADLSLDSFNAVQEYVEQAGLAESDRAMWGSALRGAGLLNAWQSLTEEQRNAIKGADSSRKGSDVAEISDEEVAQPSFWDKLLKAFRTSFGLRSGVPKFHSGGIVGESAFGSNNEMYAKLLKDEIVLRPSQFQDILGRVGASSARAVDGSNVFNISKIEMNGIQDVDGFVAELRSVGTPKK